jgi:hypothetical protein
MGRSPASPRVTARLWPAHGRYAGHLGPVLDQKWGQPPSAANASTLGDDLELVVALTRAAAASGGSRWRRGHSGEVREWRGRKDGAWAPVTYHEHSQDDGWGGGNSSRAGHVRTVRLMAPPGGMATSGPRPRRSRPKRDEQQPEGTKTNTKARLIGHLWVIRPYPQLALCPSSEQAKQLIVFSPVATQWHIC